MKNTQAEAYGHKPIASAEVYAPHNKIFFLMDVVL
jgi:hypothetical protein